MKELMKNILDQSRLATYLDNLGLYQTSRVMVHASLSSLGVVNGGAQTVVAVLRRVTGSDGAVIIPSFRDVIRSDNYALRECREHCPQNLCPSRERGYTGIIGETLRQQPDVLRSCHPTHSWVGVGGDAKFLLEGHRNSPTPCGKDSPFFRLMQRDGLILLLGVSISSITNIHAVEDVRNVPYLSAIDPPNRHATYTTSGRRLQYAYPQLLQAAFGEAGLLRSGKVGAALCHVISARALGAFLWVVTEDDPWCLVLRPCGNEYEPFQDACTKVARMLRAWRANPDSQAWRAMLAASEREIDPVQFTPTKAPARDCPAYRGIIRSHPRCAANDLPPWEKFEDYPPNEPGVATCDQCNWPDL